jgi:chromosome segregation ATPase
MASDIVDEKEDKYEPRHNDSTEFENDEIGLDDKDEDQEIEDTIADSLYVDEKEKQTIEAPVNSTDTAFDTIKNVDENLPNSHRESNEDTYKFVKDMQNGLTDKVSELGDKLSEAGDKRTEDLKEMFAKHDKTHEQYQQKMEEKDKEHHQELKEYQLALQQASNEAIKYRIIEKVRAKIAQNALSFADVVSEYDQNISQTKNSINRTKTKLQPFQNNLLEVEMKIGSIEVRYEELHHELDKIIHALKELKELKKSMKSSKYREECQRKERIIQEILDDIEQKELELLNKELDRLNKLEEMDPMLQELEKYEIGLEYLDSERIRLISVGTHQMNVQIPLENQNSEDASNYIDVPSSDTSKTNNLLTE